MKIKVDVKTETMLYDLGYKIDELNICEYKNVNAFEDALNKLCLLFFGKSREVQYHRFRGFPYIIHNNIKDNSADYSGCMFNYTKRDFFFICLVRKYLKIENCKYNFIDVEHLIKNATKVSGNMNDKPMIEMPIDQIFLFMSQK